MSTVSPQAEPSPSSWFRRSWVRWLLLALVAVIVIAGLLFWRVTTPPTPTDFYTPASPLPAGVPGTLIRSEPITTNLPKNAVAWRVLYLSTGVLGEQIAVSGVVIAPKDKGTAPRPVVAWAHGTIGVLPECGTSHAPDPFKYIPELQLMIDDGFVVAATDYPGLGTPGTHPYLVGPVEAASVLDSIRAAHQLDVNAGNRFVVWGHSQGGHAALWTGQNAFSYAPELKLLGVATAAPATDLEAVFKFGLDKLSGGILTAEAVYAWSKIYPAVDIAQVVKPETLSQVEKIAKTCITTPAAFLIIGEKLLPTQFLAVDPFTVEPYRTIIISNTPRGPIDVPILIAHGTADTIIPFDSSVADAKRRCAEGESVQLMRYPGEDHNPVIVSSGVATVGWIQDRFAGRSAGSTCGQ